MTLVDLIAQVQKVLPARFGGTGNTHGWAVDSLVGAYNNGTGATIARGSVVQLANYGTMGGGHISDSRIMPTTTANQQNVVGVSIGRFRLDSPFHEFEDADCDDGDVCAVVIGGKAYALVEGTVAVDQYAYSAATDGKAYGSDTLGQGGMGTWESAGSTRQWLRLWGAPATPGVAGAILVVFGDGVTQIQPGEIVDVPAPNFNIRLTDWILASTASGSISIDMYVDTAPGNFPPTGVDSGTDTSPPEIVSGIYASGDVPGPVTVGGLPPAGGWHRDIETGEVMRFIVESAGGVTRVTLLLNYVRR